ncbi:MAG: hypothetical protein PHU93_04095, partial [Candidatus Gracilibacteria bacterium]|nr:hypothetical protein [Candidatus Gracilibacteria bacterium]
MENLDKRKQKALIKAIILNVFGILILSLVIGYYILPAYTEIGEKVDSINMVNADLKQKTDSGLKVEDFFALATRHAKVNFSAEDKKNSKDIENLLKKTDPSVSYPEWVKTELAKKSEFDAEVEKNDKIIAGIIPTYSELAIDNSLFEKNRITLADLVSFVENDLLKKFNLTSYSNIGFTSLSFEKQQNTAVNIGTYKIALDVSGTNQDLLNFVNTVQNSGKLNIQDGKLVAPKNLETQLFSNLLISIDQITFAQSLEKLEKDNKMAVNLVFYVRAKSYTDLLKIRSSLSESTKVLLSNIKTYTELCGNLVDSVCKNENSLKAIQAIRSIMDDVKELDTQLQTSLKATSTQDISG